MLGLPTFPGMAGTGPFEDKQHLFVAPRKEEAEIQITIPGETDNMPLLLATKAGVFKITYRNSGNGPLVEIVGEGPDGVPKVISNQASGLGIWYLHVSGAGIPSVEHEVV